MSIASVRLRLQTLQSAIPGITKANAQLPRGKIPDMELPTFLNFVRPATYDTDKLGDSDVEVTRQFAMWLLVQPAVECEEGEGENLVEPFIDLVARYFLARPSLGNLIGVSDSYITEDSGPKRLVWPGTPQNPVAVYWGVEFKLDVIDIFGRIYSDNE